MADTVVMNLPDGRELAWVDLGPKRGPAVFAFHGTPGSRLQVSFQQEVIEESGVRLIAPDRPGYGHSTYHRNRTLADWANDVAQLADHLKIKRFSVIGVSGGGPHAVACAALLPDRVVAAGIVSGVAPFSDPAMQSGDFMIGVNRLFVRLGNVSERLLQPVFTAQDFALRHWPEKVIKAGLRSLPAPDAAVLSRPEVMAVFVDDAKRASATAPAAAAQDFALFGGDWGFRVEDIAVPVHIWHGDADRNVPIGHGRFFADRIPGAQLHECPGEAHLLAVDHLGEILATVAPV
jgi:pimeloyl-ACP methyl ester carboxylesterase